VQTNFAAPVAVYALVITAMVTAAMSTKEPNLVIFGQEGIKWRELVVPAGAIFFAYSDSVLALHHFVWCHVAGLQYVTITTYWIAQALFALSAIWQDDEHTSSPSSAESSGWETRTETNSGLQYELTETPI
jgi:uncharacterized membrane protein YhhN